LAADFIVGLLVERLNVWPEKLEQNQKANAAQTIVKITAAEISADVHALFK
jgi:hypothetical protein